MQSTTESEITSQLLTEAAAHRVMTQWQQLAELLPVDLDQTARGAHALQRRRQVRSATDLLRLILAYCVCDWSLRLVGGWALLVHLGDLSDVAVLQRLRACPHWLGVLIVAVLQKRRLCLTRRAGVRLRLMDATTVSQPGSSGLAWRVHLSLDLEQLCLDGIEVTTVHSGETLARFPAQSGEIRVADRGYAHAAGLGPVLAAGTQLVVRIGWQNLPLWRSPGRRWPLLPWLSRLRGLSEQRVYLQTPQGTFPLRLIACPLPPAEVNRARRRARHDSRRHGHTPQLGTLQAAGFVLLLTNLAAEQWSGAQVAELYRLRWQIELHIKRLKSLLQLDALRARDPRLVQTYLLGKLLAALLTDELTGATAQACPTWFASTNRPLSVWRLTQLWWDQLRQLVRGSIALARVYDCLPRLRRYLSDAPRRRKQQLSVARSLLSSMFTC